MKHVADCCRHAQPETDQGKKRGRPQPLIEQISTEEPKPGRDREHDANRSVSGELASDR
ncbi:uncharacterized protein METZ01_LOCUS52828 [marine metagenome]|uniref:Uncharacterized protein n=1 Tax=marine metagenome TaxID=408172 RepID=A0A381S906_9ZZZZ